MYLEVEANFVSACGGEVKCWTNETCENDTCVASKFETEIEFNGCNIIVTPFGSCISPKGGRWPILYDFCS